MTRGGMGSALVILIFTVLCLAIFSAISYITAHTSRTLMETEVSLVKAFYEADTKAEQILAEILAADTVPETIMGVEIRQEEDLFTLALWVAFEVPVAETRLLSVAVEIDFNGYAIKQWQMFDNREWTPDLARPVWMGGDEMFALD